MTDDERRELSDLNYAEASREMARRAGGAVLDEGGVLLFAGGDALPVLINGAMRTDPRVAPAEVLARARHFFAPRRRGFSVIARAHVDADLQEACTTAGLIAFGQAPGMVLDRRLPDAAPPPGVTLRAVASADDAVAFAAVMDEAYQSLGMPAGVAAAQVGRLAALAAPHIVAVLARLDGAPVAGAMTIVTHGVAGVYWVGTRAAARGRGLAELCTRAAGNACFDRGARIAALQASPMGEPVYRRMGYREVTRYPTLVQFEPPASE
ncbi:MAG: GNAT family N-acetyltransferase [Deltaproteobacteria bacterium]|nr:GNAT family N-acetyltransferase [Deltaproteobacteria bacterium]